MKANAGWQLQSEATKHIECYWWRLRFKYNCHIFFNLLIYPTICVTSFTSRFYSATFWPSRTVQNGCSKTIYTVITEVLAISVLEWLYKVKWSKISFILTNKHYHTIKERYIYMISTGYKKNYINDLDKGRERYSRSNFAHMIIEYHPLHTVLSKLHETQFSTLK